jgi:hypothetical protein
MSAPMLSTGQPSTLGVYRDNCAALFGPGSAAVAYFDGKIAEQGRDEPVLADEQQMMALIASLM